MPCEVRLLRRDNSVGWGFQLTGGVMFNMPLTIYEVQEGGEASRAGLRVGDVILKINGMATNKLALKEANALINSEDSIDLSVTNLQDQEAAELEAKMMNDDKEDEEFEAQRVDVNLLNLAPPRPAPRPDLAQRKCWHPVVLDTNPPPIIEEATGDEEAPHKKILRNFRQAMAHKNMDPSPEKPPSIKPPRPPPDEDLDEQEASEQEPSMEEQLRSMQRQLAALCALPEALQKSLAAVNEKICRLLPPEPESTLERDDDAEQVSEVVEDEVSYEEEEEHDKSIYEEEELHDASEELDVEPEEEPVETIEEETESELEPEPELTPEDVERIEKLRKLEELNRVWPWGDEIKPVYKISDRYKVPHSEVFNNKIQSIESKMVLRKPSETED